MEQALGILNRARSEITSSLEWEELKQEVLQMLRLNETSKPRTNDGLAEEVAMRLRYSQVYADLQAKVLSTLSRNFQLHKPHTAGLYDASILNACTHLLQNNPYLKLSLKKAFNHPLPKAFRKAAWKSLLVDAPNTYLEEEHTTLQKISKLSLLYSEKQLIDRKLSNLLIANPALFTLAQSKVALDTVIAVGLCWKQQNDGLLTNRDLLLIIPFALVWSEDCHMENAASGVIEVFTSFIKKLPPTMISIGTEVQRKAVSDLCEKILKLLRATNPNLNLHLEKVFINEEKSAATCSLIHKHFAVILHSAIENMLIGYVPLDVVCYILDQCFIGLTVKQFRCLHYFVTAWLNILSAELMTCSSVKGFVDVLKKSSVHLTVPQFQREIQKNFLKTLSAALQITPITISLIKEVTSDRNSLENKPKSPPTTMEATTKVVTGKVVHKDPEQKIDREKKHLQMEVSRLQRELARQQKILTIKMETEKLRCKQEVKMLHQEIAMLKKRAMSQRPPTPWSPHCVAARESPLSRSKAPYSIHENSERASQTHTVLSTNTTATEQQSLGSSPVYSDSKSYSTMDGSMNKSTRPVGFSDTQRSLWSTPNTAPTAWLSLDHTIESNTQIKRTPLSLSPVASNPKSLSIHTTEVSETPMSQSVTQAVSDPRSGVHISLENAQDIWLRIFARFTDGLYLLLHGTQKEKKNNLY